MKGVLQGREAKKSLIELDIKFFSIYLQYTYSKSFRQQVVHTLRLFLQGSGYRKCESLATSETAREKWEGSWRRGAHKGLYIRFQLA